MANFSYSDLLPRRVREATEERINTGVYQTLVFSIVSGNTSEVFAFGRLDDGRAPNCDTVYEIASVTKTFTATLLADAVLSGRLTLDTPVANLVPDFKIPESNGKKITLDHTATHFSGLPLVPSNLKPKDPAIPLQTTKLTN